MYLATLANNVLSQDEKDLGKAGELEVELVEALDTMIPPEVRQRVGFLVQELLHHHPYLQALTGEEMVQRIQMSLSVAAGHGAGKSFDACGGTCASTAVTQVIAIEAGFVGAAIGCAALTVGYGICPGAALVAKNALLVATGTSLGSCMNACPA